MGRAPELPLEQQVAALRYAGDVFLDHGITWVQEAWVDEDQIPAWIEASRQRQLTARFNLAFRLDPLNWRDSLPRFAETSHEIARSGDSRLTARTVKFFVDGVVENRSAALLTAYRDAPAHERGPANWSADELETAAITADRLGFQLHFHAIGDRAIRRALDAIEQVERLNGPRDRRPVIAHVQLVHADDLPRFARLGVTANFEPLWTQLDENMLHLTIPQLTDADRDRQFQIRSLLDSGANVSFGSDWPVTDLDWRAGLDAAITRQTPVGQPEGGWMPNERVELLSALDAYTRGSAYQAFADDAGAIAVGNRADLVLLDRDPRDADDHRLAGIRVLATWIDGIRHETSRPADDATTQFPLRTTR